MPQQEITHKRDLTYLEWHRFPTLPKWCYMTDVDCLEWRNGIGPVAIIETCNNQGNPHNKTFQIKVFQDLAQKLSIPFYIVRYHLPESATFEVYDFTNALPPYCVAPKIMNSEEYANFLQLLGSPSKPLTEPLPDQPIPLAFFLPDSRRKVEVIQ